MKKTALVLIILVCATPASAQKLAVKVIDRQDNDTDYTYVVPAHWFSNSNTNVNCGGSDTNTVGPCKNVAAYRTVVLADANGQAAINALRQFVKHDGLVFRSKHGAPLAETTILIQGLYPALKNLGLPKGGMHAFRRGCNRRWELSRVPAALIRQQMGHTSSDMTALYTGEIPTEVVKNFLQLEPNGAAVAA